MITEVFLLLVVLFLLWLKPRKPSSMPPGSYGWPILGTLPSGKISISEHMKKLQQKYGNIFTTKWGSHAVVVLADFNLIRKAFRHPDLQGRPHFLSMTMLRCHKNQGIAFSEGSVWADTRRFLQRQLLDLGMGQSVLEQSMQEEAAALIAYLERTCLDKPAVMDLAINNAVINVLWQMMASKRYDIDDPEILQYSKHSQELLEFAQKDATLLDMLPFLHRILPNFVQNKFMKVDQASRKINALCKMSERFIMEHLETLDPDNPRDIIDQFILQRAERKPDGSLTEADKESLVVIITDMFHAGSETTSTTLRWMILYMAAHPHIQTRVQKHLDEVVPKSRLPSLGDRSRLPYVDAMLLEVLRLSSLAATSLLHRATADVSFEGYVIPKDTIIVACSKLCQRDGAFWKHPDEFYPEHFLEKNGELAAIKENFMPFSIGRRQCLGEPLARMQLYLFGTAILQRFRIAPPEGVTLSLDVDPEQIISSQPLPYKVVLKRRI